MKHLLILSLFFLLFSTASIAQKIDRYCEVQCWDQSWSRDARGKWVIIVIIAKTDSVFGWKDPEVQNALAKVETFKNDIDALDYMTSIGWILVSITTTPGYRHHFFFKKSFDADELKHP